jgi:hypothetical protein
VVSELAEEDWATLILLILVGIGAIYIYFGKAIAIWWSQHWWMVVIGIIVIVIGGIVFYIKVWLPIVEEEEEELRREEELKKSIIRKRLLKERGDELESLNLTKEEKELLLKEWVEEAYKKEEILRYEPERKPIVERVPPLSQKQKEILIHKVGTRCCYPNCKETVTLTVHHIIPREKGGTNKESNLVVLCSHHHTLADRGAIPKERLRLYSVARMKKRKLGY